MRGSNQDLPVVLDIPDRTIRLTEWEGMAVELGACRETVDSGALLTGPPNDRCQCPHCGYVIRGQVRFRFADWEEVYRAGDAYYPPPGRATMYEAGCAYVEFSPATANRPAGKQWRRHGRGATRAQKRKQERARRNSADSAEIKAASKEESDVGVHGCSADMLGVRPRRATAPATYRQ
jgi:hypothetical protein